MHARNHQKRICNPVNQSAKSSKVKKQPHDRIGHHIAHAPHHRAYEQKGQRPGKEDGQKRGYNIVQHGRNHFPQPFLNNRQTECGSDYRKNRPLIPHLGNGKPEYMPVGNRSVQKRLTVSIAVH